MRARAQAFMKGKADGTGMPFTSRPEASWEFGGDPAATSWEQAGGGGHLPGLHALHQSPLPAPSHSPHLHCPPKQVSTLDPTVENPHEPTPCFFCPSSPLPTPASAFPPQPDQSLPAAGQPSPRTADRPQDCDALLSSPRIYPSGPWRAGFSARTEARRCGSTGL